MKLTFLKAAVPLTKSYEKKRDNTYAGGSYPNVKSFTSITEQVESLKDFSEVLERHAADGDCLLTNSLTEQIVDASRAKLSDKDELRQWIVLDIDGIDGIASVKEFIIKMLPAPFHDVSYILQHSPSSGIKKGVRCHIFFMLDDQVDVKSVSSWLKYANLVTESLSKQITLSNNTMALSFKLDWVANNNGRIIYIAPPECKGFSDLVTKRIELVVQKHDTLSFNFASIGAAQMRSKYREKLNSLRAAAGLTVSKAKDIYRVSGDKEFVRNEFVEPARITDPIEDNDYFMRCNLDGGDSYAYYYHRNNPKYLHNFKGEPSIPLALLDSDFHAKVAEPHAAALAEKDERPFVFRDIYTDKWFTGIRKEQVILVQPAQIGSKDKIEDYFMQKGSTSPPDPIPSWERVFNPTMEGQWHPDNEKFNTWRPSEYMLNATPRSVMPSVTHTIIRHVLGDDIKTYDHFMNWLAYIYQTRKKSGTAWVLHGVPGTGKGLLVNYIIGPLFGRDYVVSKQVKDLKGHFNGWMEHSMFVNIDEANVEDAGADQKQVVEAIKLWITEPIISIEAKNQNAHQAKSFVNFIFTTNDFGILPIQDGDRRFNVGVRQEHPIPITAEEVKSLKDELLQFAGFLQTYKVDHEAVHKTYESEAKIQLKKAAESSVDSFVRAVTEGDFEYFEFGRTETTSEYQTLDQFKKWIDRCIEDIRVDRPTVVTIAELRDAYVILVNGREMKATRFASLMAKRGNPAGRPLKDDGTRPRGWHVEWKLSDEFKAHLGAHLKVAAKTTEEMERDIKKEIGNET